MNLLCPEPTSGPNTLQLAMVVGEGFSLSLCDSCVRVIGHLEVVHQTG
jgi:hypothetical protein